MPGPPLPHRSPSSWSVLVVLLGSLALAGTAAAEDEGPKLDCNAPSERASRLLPSAETSQPEACRPASPERTEEACAGPRSLEADLVDEGIQLRWEPDPETQAPLVVHRSVNGEAALSPIGLVAPSEGTYLDEAVEPGRGYVYHAIPPTGEDPTQSACDTASRTVQPAPRPACPSGLLAQANDDPTMTVTWQAPPGASYHLVRSQEDADPQPVPTGGSPPHVDEDTAPDTRYTYRLLAVSPSGSTRNCAEATAKTTAAASSHTGYALVGLASIGALGTVDRRLDGS